MKKVAIVICNYNGGKDTVNCIKSLMNSDFDNFDIVVVDNASEDGSVDLLRENFSDDVYIIRNEENRGGSGGFGRGMRYAADEGYEYTMLLDNDAIVDIDTVGMLYDYSMAHPNVGAVGAKIMMLDDKERIFDFAKRMNWDNFCDVSEWVGKIDSPETENAFECDYVAATAAMLRTATFVEVGGMDEEHFIYHDDIDLCQRIRMAGYKVVCLGTTKAWHRSNLNKVPINTFAGYYLTRNRYHFFAKYLPVERLEEFSDYVINQVFPYIYGSHKSGREDMFFTYKYILEDFMNDVRGKAREGRINPILNLWPANIARLIGDKTRVAICMLEGARETTYKKLTDAIGQMNKGIIYDKVESIYVEGYDLVIALCDHVKEQHVNILPAVYIDAYGNIVDDYDTYLYFQNYDNAYKLFKHMYKHSVMEGINRIRNN